MTRFGWRIFGVLLVVIAGFGLMVRAADHPTERWHINPVDAVRTGKPNDYVAAPEGAVAAEIDRLLLSAPADPLMAFDRVARSAPRTNVVAGSVAEGFITYVQRSALIGFPDYVSVVRIDSTPPSIAIWSRSRYGYSDMGVNKARIDAWLQEAGFE
ncbi:MAG: DUF1499 domain-containing protein [Pseudomonadota bacterium]